MAGSATVLHCDVRTLDDSSGVGVLRVASGRVLSRRQPWFWLFARTATGSGRARLAVLDADDGDVVRSFTTEGTFGRATFEGARVGRDAVVADGDQAAIVRCSIDAGDCELATEPAAVIPDDPELPRLPVPTHRQLTWAAVTRHQTTTWVIGCDESAPKSRLRGGPSAPDQLRPERCHHRTVVGAQTRSRHSHRDAEVGGPLLGQLTQPRVGGDSPSDDEMLCTGTHDRHRAPCGSVRRRPPPGTTPPHRRPAPAHRSARAPRPSAPPRS